MAVKSVTEDLPSGSGRISEDGGRYNREFIVETDTFDDNAITVVTAPGLPQYHDHFKKGNDEDVNSVVTVIDPNRDTTDPLTWRVRYEYNRILYDGDGLPGGVLTIEKTLPQITISEEFEEEIVWKTVDTSNPTLYAELPPEERQTPRKIVNAAYDFFQPMPTRRIRIKVFTFTVYYRSYTQFLTALEYDEKCNHEVFWGINAGYLKLSANHTGTRQADRFGTYWPVNWTMRHHPKGWWLDLDNVGFNELVNNGGVTLRRRIRDENNQYITQPVFLYPPDDPGGNAGKPFPPDQIPPDPLRFHIFEWTDFSGLQIPDIDVSFIP